MTQARISRQLSAATPNLPAPASLRSLGRLNAVFTMPTSPSLRAPFICGHLRRFATIPGEKSGLVLSKAAGGACKYARGMVI